MDVKKQLLIQFEVSLNDYNSFHSQNKKPKSVNFLL